MMRTPIMAVASRPVAIGRARSAPRIAWRGGPAERVGSGWGGPGWWPVAGGGGTSPIPVYADTAGGSVGGAGGCPSASGMSLGSLYLSMYGVD